MKTQNDFKQTMMMMALGAMVMVGTSVASAADHTVVQKDKQFSTKTIKVKAGDRVVFKNEEKAIAHNVYSLGPKNAFELKIQQPGNSSAIDFKDKGVTEVECAIHPTMKIKVEVE